MNTILQTQMKAEPSPSFTPTQSRLLQRKCASDECAERRKKQLTLQRNSTNQAEPQEVPPIVHEVLRSSGQPLDPATRTAMEPRFGHDFSQVRVHMDAKTAESARSVGALAYTVGQDMVFGTEEYEPRTMEGKRLLAHELTHVVQQKDVAPGAYMSAPPLPSGPVNDSLEREALIHAERSTATEAGPAVRLTPSNAQLRRQIDFRTERFSSPGPTERKPAMPLPFREATELSECLRIMGQENMEVCRQIVLGEKLPPPAAEEPAFPVSGLSTCFCDEGDTFTKGKGVACDTGKCPDETGVFAAWPNTSDACKKKTSEGKNVPRAKCKETLTVSHGGKSVEVRVRDCGPGGKGRIIDLSLAASKALDPKVKNCSDWGNDKVVVVSK